MVMIFVIFKIGGSAENVFFYFVFIQLHIIPGNWSLALITSKPTLNLKTNLNFEIVYYVLSVPKKNIEN